MPREWEKQCKQNYKEIRKSQDQKLRAFMANQIYLYSPYYSQRFKAMKIDPIKIRGVDDLKHLPFTFKEDIAPTDEEPFKTRSYIIRPDEKVAKEYGHMAKLSGGQPAVEQRIFDYKPVHVHFTAGLTSQATPFVNSLRDIGSLRESGCRLLEVLGLTRDSRLLNALPFGPYLTFWQFYLGAEQLNLLALHGDGEINMDQQAIFKAVNFLHPDAIAFTPGFAGYILREAVISDQDFSSVKKVVLANDRVALGLREKLRSLLVEMGSINPSILATYGITEGRVIWGECREDSGYHLYPDLEIIEIVNPQTGESVGEGEEGEIVYTALNWRGTCLIRYRTGDIARGGIIYEPCPNCLKTTPRISSQIERKSNMVELNLTRGKNTAVNCNDFYSLLTGLPEVLEWQVEISKSGKDAGNLDEVVLYIALKDGVDTGTVTSQVRQLILDKTGAHLKEIILLPAGQLVERLGLKTGVKEKRVIDNRPA